MRPAQVEAERFCTLDEPGHVSVAAEQVIDEFPTRRLDQLRNEAAVSGDDGRRQVVGVLMTAAAAALEEIDAAMSRLGDGTYGICEGCADPIPLARLEVLPTSRSCTPCQSRVEARRPGRGNPARRI